MGPNEEMLLTRHKELTGQSGAKSPGTLPRFSLTRLLFHSPKQTESGLDPGSAQGRGLGATAQGPGRGGGGVTPSPRSAERHGLGPGLGSGPRSGGPGSGQGHRSGSGPGVEQGTNQSQHNSFAYTTAMRRSWMVSEKTRDKGNAIDNAVDTRF